MADREGPLGEREVGALQVARFAALDDDPVGSVKESPGLVFGWHIKNTTGAALYVDLFDADNGDVTAGTTVPKISIGIEANGKAEMYFNKGIRFNTAIAVTSVTAAGGGTGAASDVNILYG